MLNKNGIRLNVVLCKFLKIVFMRLMSILHIAVCACSVCAQSQLCLTVCDPMNYSPSGSSVHGIVHGKVYWSELPFPPPGDLPDPGMKPASPELAGRFSTIDPPGKRGIVVYSILLCRYTTVYLSILLSMDIGLFLILCYYHLYCHENCKGR